MSTLNIFGQTVEGVTLDPLTTWESVRWPFGGRIVQQPDGSLYTNLSSGGTVLWTAFYPAGTELAIVATALDAASKAIFAQAAWYQQP